ncbi:hypothetical protein HYU11_04140 [Candidatus Woesearchaeota archaeon]|nr:hypothetical protein [Candidatus Woesearchaeota archaeon]
MPNTKTAKEKLISGASSASGISGIFSSYNLCHSICMAAISLLSVIGITVTGMPLLFLQQIATPIWLIGVSLFLLTLFLYFKYGKCISKNLIIANFGMLTIGTPFIQETPYKIYFWAIGGLTVLAAAAIFIKEKSKK